MVTVENRSARSLQESSSGRCVVCEHALEGSRCSHCGAAATAGRFTVVKQIAQTPRGRMYLAEDDAGRRVALKELVFSAIPGLAQLDSFRREARLLAELDHPAIPRFVDSFEEGTGVACRLYIAQEFLEGESLAQEMERRRFDEAEARAIAEQVLEVLVWLQRRSPPVFHRDLKPANLLRRKDGSIALVDFGSARDASIGTLGATIDVGTFGYAPPEQLGGDVDATSDLFALGATLVHLLTRKPPRESLADGAPALATGEPIRSVIRRLCAPAREDRFAGAEEALRAIRGEVSAVRSRPRKSRRRATTLAAAALGIALLASAAVVATFKGTAETSTSAVAALQPADASEPVVRRLHARAWDSTALGADPALEKMVFRDVIIAGAQDTAELRAFVDADRRSMAVYSAFAGIVDAQQAYRAKHGSYLAFDEASAATWKTLGVAAPDSGYRFSASIVGGKLAMEAIGNADADAFLDRFTSNEDVSQGNVLQTAHDTVNFDYVTFAVEDQPSEGVPPLIRELAVVQRRALTARPNLAAIESAQGVYKQGHGSYLEFDDLTPDVARRLGVTLPAKAWHRYSAHVEEGKLVLEAKADLDGDPEPDEWEKREGEPKARQRRIDWWALGERPPGSK